MLFFVVAAIAGLVAYRAVPDGLAADARPGDRGGQADQADARVGHDTAPPVQGADAVSNEPEIYTAAPASRSPGAPPARPGAARPRSAPTSSASARSSSHSVEALRGRVTELTDWRRQVREHRRELIIGAAVVGFAVGGLIALRRALAG